MSHHTKSSGILWKAIQGKTKYLLGLGIATIVAIAFTIYINQTNSLDYYWGKILDPLLGLGTFILAVIIWFDAIRKEYIQNLPKRLSVLYKVNGHPILYYHEAFLSSDKDIRPWAQQLARQVNEQNLKFTPFFNRIHELPVKNKNAKGQEPNYFLLHLLEVHLTGGYKISDKKPNRDTGLLPEVIEEKFVKKGKDISSNTLIILTVDGGKKVTDIYKDELAESDIPPATKVEILEALKH